MKRFLMLSILFLTLIFAPFAFAGALQIDKSPGDPVDIEWSFPAPAESTIEGFVIEQAADIQFTAPTET
ncbi:MAG: hypothetical protein ACRD2L_21965, partial [Terriglobia bacterium]